jgi:ubiquinone/menaquinone biosynthesis C-methylase UbiE
MPAQDPQLEQRRYYERTAGEYDSAHGHEREPEHRIALTRIVEALNRIGAKRVLDVGSGTGRGIGYLLADGGFDVHGIEPVPALIERAVENGIPRERLTQGSGERLPFDDGSFDAVLAIGVLHHVPDADAVIAEMQRVARRAIFISDANRFGRSGAALGLFKLLLAKTRVWPLAFRVRTLGKGYVVTEGDGVAYSYSVYDSVGRFRDWADELEIIATTPTRVGSWFGPLLTASHVLLTATRHAEPRP